MSSRRRGSARGGLLARLNSYGRELQTGRGHVPGCREFWQRSRRSHWARSAEDPAFLLWFFALLHLRAHGREPQSLSAGHWSPPYEPAQPSQKIIHHSWPARLRPILKRWQQHGRWHAGKVMPRPPEAGAPGCRPCLEPGASTAAERPTHKRASAAGNLTGIFDLGLSQTGVVNLASFYQKFFRAP